MDIETTLQFALWPLTHLAGIGSALGIAWIGDPDATFKAIKGEIQRIRRLEADKEVSCPFVAQDRRISLETRRNNRMEFVSWIKPSKGRRSTDG